MTHWHGGKGSAIRPLSVDNKTYQSNWDLIFRKSKSEDNTGVDKNEYQDIISTEDCFPKDLCDIKHTNVDP